MSSRTSSRTRSTSRTWYSTTTRRALGEFQLTVNPRVLGPRLGKQVQEVIRAVKAGQWSQAGDVVTAAGAELRPGEYELKLTAADPDSTTSLPGSNGLIALDIGGDTGTHRGGHRPRRHPGHPAGPQGRRARRLRPDQPDGGRGWSGGRRGPRARGLRRRGNARHRPDRRPRRGGQPRRRSQWATAARSASWSRRTKVRKIIPNGVGLPSARHCHVHGGPAVAVSAAWRAPRRSRTGRSTRRCPR